MPYRADGDPDGVGSNSCALSDHREKHDCNHVRTSFTQSCSPEVERDSGGGRYPPAYPVRELPSLTPYSYLVLAPSTGHAAAPRS